MRLLIVQAWNRDETAYRSRFSSLLSYPSLTLAVLYALVPAGMFETIDVIDENSQHVDYDRVHYDLVLISFETSSAISAYRHCEEFRKRGSYVAVGGYHATALPEEAGQYCDTVISGPAEKALPVFLQDWISGHAKPFYRDTTVCPADYPVPARDKVTKRGKLKIPAVIADRGCMNACKYCSMRTMWKSNPRPVADVIAELKSLKARHYVFYDPNFFGKREYAIELMRAMEPLHILWASDATADFGCDHELMDIAYRSGCRGVVIGLESINSQSLSGVHKRFHNADKYEEIIRNIHSHHIGVNGCFVLGFDDDTEEELRSLPERVDRLGLDLCKFAILTPYPGTKLYDEMEQDGRILTKNWDLYNQHHVVYQPAHIAPERLHSVYREVWKNAYRWGRVSRRVFGSPALFHGAGGFLLGANIGFHFIGIR
ncbi:MAG: B12-binding domain-containing radical SAM protein [Oscillospiraceae bacterium]|nr:B12-binding domain-containing radical SAM protein [Oscillospiraceae bacterium]